MKRRQFVALWASAAAVGSVAARAQSTTRTRSIGLLIVNAEHDVEGQMRAEAFRRALANLGWVEGRNLRMHVRWGVDDAEVAQRRADELLGLDLDVIVVNGSPGLSALQRGTGRTPVVFVVVTDPLGAGYVRSLARPGGNITGFSTFEPPIGGKWLGLLKEVSPALTRVACILDPGFQAFTAIWREIEVAGRSLGIKASTIVFRDSADALEAAVASFAKEPAGGLIVSPSAINNAARDRIVSTAARYRLPAIYPFQHFADAGGLLAYGFDPRDLFARSAAYVDRILRGERPGDLPVQAPTKYELIVNLKTAKALDLQVPALLLARADRVIE